MGPAPLSVSSPGSKRHALEAPGGGPLPIAPPLLAAVPVDCVWDGLSCEAPEADSSSPPQEPHAPAAPPPQQSHAPLAPPEQQASRQGLLLQRQEALLALQRQLQDALRHRQAPPAPATWDVGHAPASAQGLAGPGEAVGAPALGSALRPAWEWRLQKALASHAAAVHAQPTQCERPA